MSEEVVKLYLWISNIIINNTTRCTSPQRIECLMSLSVSDTEKVMLSVASSFILVPSIAEEPKFSTIGG